MENWKDLYLELAEILGDIEGIRWVDLWHNQVNFLEEEHPFPAPAAFISFRARPQINKGQHIQELSVQVDVYLFYETFADTYKGAINQNSALKFLELLTKIHVALHGKSGEYFSEMQRLSVETIDTGSAQNLYRQVFECTVTDISADDSGIDVDSNTNTFNDYQIP